MVGRSMGDRRACMVERRLGGAMMAWMYLTKRKGEGGRMYSLKQQRDNRFTQPCCCVGVWLTGEEGWEGRHGWGACVREGGCCVVKGGVMG